jgi:hypothetical protein
MQKIVIGMALGLSILSVGAKQLPGLYCLPKPQPNNSAEFNGPNAGDYNVLVEHIQELERKVDGMQKQITILHAKLR